MAKWIPTPSEFLRHLVEHASYGVCITALVWIVTFVWSSIKGLDPFAVWIISLAAGACMAIVYIAIRLALAKKEQTTALPAASHHDQAAIAGAVPERPNENFEYFAGVGQPGHGPDARPLTK